VADVSEEKSQSSTLKNKPSGKNSGSHRYLFLAGFCLVYSPILKMKAIFSSEMHLLPVNNVALPPRRPHSSCSLSGDPQIQMHFSLVRKFGTEVFSVARISESESKWSGYPVWGCGKSWSLSFSLTSLSMCSIPFATSLCV
jgi:hypothetical protein